jgi:three-Cys-motif partner protein
MARSLRKSAAIDPFFGEPQGAAKLKHEVLRQHLTIYANKTGRRAPVVFLDGYAGPGRYGDGSPGSPKLMVDAARALREHRNIHCIFVEEDSIHWQQLKAMLAEFGDDDSEALHGRLEEHLDEILTKSVGKSLHVFLDPYGLAIPFRTLVDMLRRRPRNGPRGFQPTEVILNFSINGITRAAGRLDKRHEDPAVERGRETRLRGLEEFLDGQWWHHIWRAGGPDRVAKILDGYLERFRAEMRGWKTLPVPVADRWNGPPSY